MPMKMAVKTSADCGYVLDKDLSINGRLKSDITHGKERLYERSYY